MRPAKHSLNLDGQLDVLASIAAEDSRFLTAEQFAEAEVLLERATIRRGLSADHTTIGLFGATGSGKSSVFNALVGSDHARISVIRPTTFATSAAVWHPEGSAPLLDWLQVSDVVEAASGDNSPPLILLDLPDFDSVSPENRKVARQLVGQVDVLVWVVDPQKYADRVIHSDFIRPLAHQDTVTVVVLNQVDLLSEDARHEVEASLRELLDGDGIGRAPMYKVSALTDYGIRQLRDGLFAIARKKAAANQRLSADIAKWALEVDTPDFSTGRANSGELVNRIAQASHLNAVVDAVGTSYRRRSTQRTGWKLTSWISRFRSDPLRRLHVESPTPNTPRNAISSDPANSQDQSVKSRSSLPAISASAQAMMSNAVRDYADQLSQGFPIPWRGVLIQQSLDVATRLPDRVDQVFTSFDYGIRKSWWAGLASILQWLALLVSITGLGWYLVAWAAAALALPVVPISKFEGWPVPGMMIAFGLLLGIVLAAAFSVIGTLVARSKQRRAQKYLTRGIRDVVEQTVIAPLDNTTGEALRLQNQLRKLGQ